jgi:AmiR/NasT family two-component response regulator
VGALNVYGLTGTPFSEDAERIARTFACFAGIVLASAGLQRDLTDLSAQLAAAVRSRAVIDQAKGIIMAQTRCSGDEAFQVLVRTSQNRNLKLKLLAEQVIDSTTTRNGAARAGVTP